MNIRFMSFNTQHCLNYRTREIDFQVMADAIKKVGGEIIGLQEMRNEGPREDYADQAKMLSELTGYPYYYFAQAIAFEGKYPYGNAIVSKYPILSCKTVMIPDPSPMPPRGETRCILNATLDVGVPLTVLVSHFGLSPEEKRNAVDTVIGQIAEEKCVLMGDFNITPDNELLSEISERMFDTAELFDAPKLSFPSDAPTRKIDYIFTSRDLKVLSADIPDIVSSDHRPYICDIEI